MPASLSFFNANCAVGMDNASLALDQRNLKARTSIRLLLDIEQRITHKGVFIRGILVRTINPSKKSTKQKCPKATPQPSQESPEYESQQEYDLAGTQLIIQWARMLPDEIFGVSSSNQMIYQLAFSWSKHLHLCNNPSLPRIDNGARNVAGSSLY
ncbi:uncharacterized protein BDCG_02721 [Blastomyces dermatitidis ER-3]|uniref:Uncharacterized protein n=1 Tax=Ajellomyces dermatitidis (strain ER-3 / ATCC MYA-2586) TaxID=559297 RepID=A0ABP2EX20_AJEDR|nr:uncharacterized protein BDCG_02721 [Blastomyces dermatitidis ER-3]EEQ87601.2 hypothetical protein BDCG_02721 [Blastomyces dermatitidis ER-3]